MRDDLNRRAQAQGPNDQRAANTGRFDHAARALDSSMVDIDYLRAALVLTRLEWAETHGKEREKRAAQHAAIWAKLEGQSAAPMRERGASQREWVDLDPQGADPMRGPEQERRPSSLERGDLAPPIAAPARPTLTARPSPAFSRTNAQPFSAARVPPRSNQSWKVVLCACLLGAGLLVTFGFMKGYYRACLHRSHPCHPEAPVKPPLTRTSRTGARGAAKRPMKPASVRAVTAVAGKAAPLSCRYACMVAHRSDWLRAHPHEQAAPTDAHAQEA